jgi:hypothetical protein
MSSIVISEAEFDTITNAVNYARAVVGLVTTMHDAHTAISRQEDAVKAVEKLRDTPCT